MMVQVGDSPHMPVRWRSHGAILISNLFMGLSIGMFLPLLPIRLDGWGIAPFWIGVNAAASACAILITGPTINRVLRRFGYAGTLMGGALLCAATLAVMPLFPGFWSWTLLRFLASIGISIHWVVSESWLNQTAREQERGRVLALYVMAILGGMACGPLMLDLVGIDGHVPFWVMAAAALAGALAVPFGRRQAPVFENILRDAMLPVFRRAPRLLGATLLMGVAQGTGLTLLALYGLKMGLESEQAAGLLTALVGGGVVLQFPIGWLSDRCERHGFAAALALISLIGAALLHPAVGTAWLLYPLLFILGGALFGLYTVALALLGQRFAGRDMAIANAAMVVCWELGTFSGGPISGGVMQIFGPVGLPLVIGVASGLAGSLFLIRMIALRRAAGQSTDSE